MDPQSQPTNSNPQPVAEPIINSIAQEQQNLPPSQTDAMKPPKKKMSKGLKIALCIIIPFLCIFLVVGIVLAIAFNNNDKMTCTSTYATADNMTITLYFNEEEIVGYSAVNMDYDLDEQQAYSKRVGVQKYLQEFEKMFENDFAGTCKIEYKK